MINGGQSYRWQQLKLRLEWFCDGLLWLAPLVLALDKAIAPVSIQNGVHQAIWPLIIVAIWGAALLIYQAIVKKTTNQLLIRTLYLILTMILLVSYLLTSKELTSLVVVAMASVIFNSLLYANFGLLFANLIGAELLVLFSGQLIESGDASYIFKNILVLFGLVYGAVLLMLSLHNSDQVIKKADGLDEGSQLIPIDYLNSVISGLDKGVIKLDKQLKVELHNDLALKIIGSKNSLVGQAIDEVLSLVNLDNQPIQTSNLITDTRQAWVSDELICRTIDERTVHLELAVMPILNRYGVNESNQYFLLIKDITSVKNHDLGSREFVKVISRELYGPIADAQTSLDQLESSLKKADNRLVLKNNLKKVQRQVALLTSRVNELAALARADQTEVLQSTVFNLADLLQGLFEKNQSAVLAKGLEFNLDLDPKIAKIVSQPIHIEEILQNLLTNAIEYTDSGMITLAAYDRSRSVEIAIIDTGRGIAKTYHSKIFEKFYQLDDRKNKPGGVGLGLYIAQQLAHKIGADIKVKSHVGLGSTFSLIIPKPSKTKS